MAAYWQVEGPDRVDGRHSPHFGRLRVSAVNYLIRAPSRVGLVAPRNHTLERTFGRNE